MQRKAVEVSLSYHVDVLNCSSAPASAVGDRCKRPGRITSAAATADISSMTSCLHAGDFRERCRGLEMLRDLAENSPVAVSNNVTMVSQTSLLSVNC